MKIEGLIMGSVTNSSLIIPKWISGSPPVPGRGEQGLGETSARSWLDEWGFGAAVIELLNYSSPKRRPHRLSHVCQGRAKVTGLLAQGVRVTAALSNEVAVSGLKETRSAGPSQRGRAKPRDLLRGVRALRGEVSSAWGSVPLTGGG